MSIQSSSTLIHLFGRHAFSNILTRIDTRFRKTSSITIALSLLIAVSAYSKNDHFEDPPALQASDVLPDTLLEGPYHKIHDDVPVIRYGYQFTLDTNHGEMIVWSKALLHARVRELAAIEKLNDVSQTQAFITSITEAAKNPIMGSWKIATKPVSTLKGLPSGASRYLKGSFYRIKKTRSDISETAAEMTKKKDEKEKKEKSVDSISKQATKATSDASKEHLGFNKAKRAWAKRMKVDPYSENEVLQKALERIAWATSLGSFAADVSIPSYAPLNYANEVQNLVWETPPIELERQNGERLRIAGIDEQIINDFHDHPHYKITTKTAIALTIEKLEGVKGLSLLLEVVLAANDKYEATMMINLSAILSNYHELQTPLERIEIKRGMIAAIDQNDTLILPVAIEYLHWTPLAQEIADDDTLKSEHRELWITGRVSPNSLEQLTNRGWETSENCFELFLAKER